MSVDMPLIDVNASLGNWPFRQLHDNTPKTLIELMDANGIDQAWVASFDAVLNREPKTANVALTKAVAPYRDRLVPFAVVNPNFPTWQADIDLYLGELGFAGLRTYPNYFQYALDEPCFGELLDCVGERGVPLQVAPRVADERMHHPLVKVPAVDITKLDAQLDRAGDATIILINTRAGEQAVATKLAKEHANVFMEISHVEGVGGVALLMERLSDDQVLFGTHAPLLYAVSAVLKLREADLSEEQLAKVSGGNARGILP